MDDLSQVEDLLMPGVHVMSAERFREQIRWSQKNRRSCCVVQKMFYTETAESPERVVIIVTDLYDERWPTLSVTNDAEYIVRKAYNTQGDHPIIYRDTEGRYDELRHREGYFACFRSLDTTDMNEAVRKVLALHEMDAKAHGDRQ